MQHFIKFSEAQAWDGGTCTFKEIPVLGWVPDLAPSERKTVFETGLRKWPERATSQGEKRQNIWSKTRIIAQYQGIHTRYATGETISLVSELLSPKGSAEEALHFVGVFSNLYLVSLAGWHSIVYPYLARTAATRQRIGPDLSHV